VIADRILRSRLASRATEHLLLSLPPERAHALTLRALETGLAPAGAPDPAVLGTTLAGLRQPNPVGMAAGFAKNGEAARELFGIGFGFVEVGTVTPRPQPGNPQPRLFRLPRAEAIINRMGFNSEGHEAVYRRLVRAAPDGVLGVNIGANKDSTDFVADYVAGVKRFADVASYLTVNISSPNTPGLRNLQAREALERLLGEVLATRVAQPRRVPVFLKLAPDLDETAMDDIARAVLATDLDGLIVSNTTISRDAVAGLPDADQAGGLSGRPLFNLSTRRLAQMRQRVGSLPIIGVGGIHSAASAVDKFEAGADAIQLYSALVYGGLALLDEIKAGLVAAVREAGGNSVAALTGRRVDDWAAGRASR
jgi:dihydroorotate dehydrogenase